MDNALPTESTACYVDPKHWVIFTRKVRKDMDSGTLEAMLPELSNGP